MSKKQTPSPLLSLIVVQISTLMAACLCLGLLVGAVDLSLAVFLPLICLLLLIFLLGIAGITVFMRERTREKRVMHIVLAGLSTLACIAVFPALLMGFPLMIVGKYLGEQVRPVINMQFRVREDARIASEATLLESLNGETFVVEEVYSNYILTKEGYVFYYVSYYPEDTVVFSSEATRLLAGKTVRVTIPIPVESYIGGGNGYFIERKDSRYSDIPVTRVTLDGVDILSLLDPTMSDVSEN